MKNLFMTGLILGLTLDSVPALAARLPTKVGQCSNTQVRSVGTRLEDSSTHKPVPDSGSAILFTNGGYQVSYDTVAAITRSRPMDRVQICLQSLPENCPPGDTRGRFYKTTNLRTGSSWTLPDAEHFCGGA
jgi:hypothetical protein